MTKSPIRTLFSLCLFFTVLAVLSTAAPALNRIHAISAPETLDEGASSVALRIDYETGGPVWDLQVMLLHQRAGGAWVWFGGAREGVPAGRSSKTMAFNISNRVEPGASLPRGDRYLFIAKLIRRSDGSERQATAGVSVIGALRDEVFSFSAPDRVGRGNLARVRVDFEASQARVLRIMLLDQNWRYFAGKFPSVPAGGGSKEVDLSIPSGMPLGRANWLVELAPVGGGGRVSSQLAMPVVIDEEERSVNRGFIPADDGFLQYTGRIDFSDRKAPRMPYGGTYIRARFEGTSLKIRATRQRFNGESAWFGIRIDGGEEIQVRLPNDSTGTYNVVSGLEDRVHDVLIYRRNEARVGWVEFLGLELDSGSALRKPPARPERRIVFYGDSITAGFYNVPNECAGKGDDCIDFDRYPDGTVTNSYFSFGSYTARALDADYHLLGLPGLAMQDGVSKWMQGRESYNGGRGPGWERTYARLDPKEPGDIYSDWGSFVPHLVVVAIAQNDGNLNGRSQAEIDSWKASYRRTLQSLREKWPDTVFVLTTSGMGHDIRWDDEVIPAVAESVDGAHFFRYSRAGRVTSGHPRANEQEDFARELVEFIEMLQARGDLSW